MSVPKSILLHVDNSGTGEQRQQIAGRLAEAFDGDVTALYAVSTINPAFPFAAPSTAEAAAARAARTRWAETTFAGQRAFSRQARCADLMVLGRNEPGKEPKTCLPPDFQWVLIENGRPGLVTARRDERQA